MHCCDGPRPLSLADAMRFRVNRTGAGLGAAFPSYSGPRAGFSVSDTGTSTKNASKYSGTACPPGMSTVKTGRTPRPPKFVGDVSYDEFVYCKPIAVSAPSALPPPQMTNVITVSPNIQTAVSPQISPVFQQVQDSPGATQGATTAQIQPGGQTGSGGGAGTAPPPPDNSAALLQFMRDQAAQAAADRAAQQAAQSAAQQKADAANAQMRADYEAALKTAQAPQAPELVAQMMPAGSYAPPAQADTVAPETPPPQSPPWPLIAIGVIVVGGGIYFLARKRRK